jgi:hypothetical protein
MAQLLKDLRGAVIQEMEVGALILRHTPPCETVDTSDISVEESASKTSY